MPKKPTLAITYVTDDWNKTTPISNPKNRLNYERFYRDLDKRGVRTVRASIKWLSPKGFSKAWTFQDGAWKKTGPIKPSLIWEASSYNHNTVPIKELMAEHFPVVNPLKLEQLFEDKYLTFLAFQKYSPHTQLVHSTKQAIQGARRITSRKVVVKPNIGFGGKDIYIISKRELRTLKIKRNTLLQEYIDSTGGIPGVTRGAHDFRVNVINGNMLASFFRTPAKGSLISNISLGGSYTMFPVSKIPKRVKAIVREVDQYIATIGPRFYTVDFLFAKNGRPYLVEANPKPSLLSAFDERTHKKIINFFEELTKQS